jgi:hypothetical protein
MATYRGDGDMGSFMRRLVQIYPTKGADLEPDETILLETCAQFFRPKLRGIPVTVDRGRLFLTDQRLLFAPWDDAKVLSALTSLSAPWLGPKGTVPLVAIAKVSDYLHKSRSLPLITGVRASGEASVIRLPRLSVADSTGDEHRIGIGSLDAALPYFPKANTEARDALVEAIRRQIGAR